MSLTSADKECAVCDSTRAHVTFIFSPVVDPSVTSAISFLKKFIPDIKAGTKSSTVRGRAPRTWFAGSRAKAKWYPLGHGSPTYFGTLTLTSVTTLRVRDFTMAHVTTNQTLSDYIRVWVLLKKKNETPKPCTCGHLATMIAV